MRYLDIDHLDQLDESKLKDKIEKELEAQNEREKMEQDAYNKRKEELLQNASKRDVDKYEQAMDKLK